MDFLEYLNGISYICGRGKVTLVHRDNFENEQAGYRYNYITKEDLTSTEKGRWQPSWYIIAFGSHSGDPYFIDTDDNCIYFVRHDGSWNKNTKVASDIEHFIRTWSIIDDVVGYGSDYKSLETKDKMQIIDDILEVISINNPAADIEHYRNNIELAFDV